MGPNTRPRCGGSRRRQDHPYPPPSFDQRDRVFWFFDERRLFTRAALAPPKLCDGRDTAAPCTPHSHGAATACPCLPSPRSRATAVTPADGHSSPAVPRAVDGAGRIRHTAPRCNGPSRNEGRSSKASVMADRARRVSILSGRSAWTSGAHSVEAIWLRGCHRRRGFGSRR